MNNIIKNTILFAATIVINIFGAFFLIFSINNFYDVLIFLIYLALNAGVLYYFYISMLDILKIMTVKGIIKNDFVLNSIISFITNLVWNSKSLGIEKVFSQLQQNKYIVLLINRQIPLSEIITDDTLSNAVKENEKEKYSSILKDKIISYINEVEISYKKVYVLLAINISTIPFFYYLLNI